uniref:Uncharacterized protein n=1 Tax=Ralstonia solanacearum TaxID=305 RepID=A0A0S4V6M2_RALSL|nr:protein of unknown function [Ralstonia solanacearum]
MSRARCLSATTVVFPRGGCPSRFVVGVCPATKDRGTWVVKTPRSGGQWRRRARDVCVRGRGARDWGEAGGARLHPCRVARIAIVLVLCWCVRGSTASRTDGVEAMTYPEALHAVPASWGVAPREAVEGVWNQRVPKLATVAVNVAPQEVLCPSKAMGTPPTVKCSSPSMMTQS